nr:MAG TPA: hypothetical protein [Caudoviricetes sp.]
MEFKKIAVLIDADNTQRTKLDEIIQENTKGAEDYGI